MSDVAHLVTIVDIGDGAVSAEDLEAPFVDGPASEAAEPGVAPRRSAASVDDPREASFSALHQAVLHDGRRLTLLDDRGWSVTGPAGIWQQTSTAMIEADARTVVGPDEPYGSLSTAEMESAHWASLAGTLREQGVLLNAEELSRLPHYVELSERLRSRITSI